MSSKPPRSNDKTSNRKNKTGLLRDPVENYSGQDEMAYQPDKKTSMFTQQTPSNSTLVIIKNSNDQAKIGGLKNRRDLVTRKQEETRQLPRNHIPRIQSSKFN